MLSVAADGAIYGSAGAITSLSPDGRLNWFLPGSEWGPVLRAPNSVFLPLAPWGFDLNGTPRWNGTVPAAVQPNVAAEDGSLIGIEELELSGGPWTRITHFTENGATVWSTRLEYSGLNPNAYRLLSVMDQNGTLYIPAHSIWAVHTGLRPARSGWPMWRGDWRNSGSVFTQDLPLPPRNLLRASVDSASTTLEYTGEYGKTYSLESSNDLIQWTVVQTFAENLNLALETRSSKQFFRVTQE
jgi:hypothetical protein